MQTVWYKIRTIATRLDNLNNVDWSQNPDAARAALDIIDNIDRQIEHITAIRNRLLDEFDNRHTITRGSN